MKWIEVDQVARALVRLGIVLVAISIIVMILQATPLLAQTSSVTCTSATGLPVDAAAGAFAAANVIFDFDAQTCIIDGNATASSAMSVGSMRAYFFATATNYFVGYVNPALNSESELLSDIETCAIPGGSTVAGECERVASPLTSGTYIVSNILGGTLVTLSVDVTVNGVNDIKLNSATVVIGTPATLSTPDMIGDYLGARNSFILNHQPDRSRRLARFADFPAPTGERRSMATGFAASGTLPVSVSLQGNMLAYSGSARHAMASLGGVTDTPDAGMPDLGRWDIWSEGRFALFDDGASQSGDFGIVHFGADYLFSPSILMGARAQVDWGEQNFATTNGTVSGIGVMVGPYATVALSQTLFLDVAASWGVSSNDISPVGTYTDQFDTTRWMVDASLAGQFHHGAWTMRPIVTVQYIAEHQQAYTDSLSARITDQTVSQGQVSFSPYLGRAWALDGGIHLTTWVEGSGHYAFGRSGTVTAGSYADELDGLNAGVRAGLDFAISGGASASLSGQYGGIGTNSESYGGSLAISLPLN